MKTQRETPDDICELLISKSSLFSLKKGMQILEPSAGFGKIIKKISDISTIDITAVELNEAKHQTLQELQKTIPSLQEVVRGDFLTIQFSKKFDRIIACPPFKGNTDIFHIQKMYELLEDKGILVTLTSPYWVTNNEEHQLKFREWLSQKEYSMTLLPDNSFIENHKSVPTALLIINKK